MCVCLSVCVHIYTHTHTYVAPRRKANITIHAHKANMMIHARKANTGWRRLIGCLKLQVISRKRATNYRALLRKMTYEYKASYASWPPCIMIHARMYVERVASTKTQIKYVIIQNVSSCRRGLGSRVSCLRFWLRSLYVAIVHDHNTFRHVNGLKISSWRSRLTSLYV